MSTLWKVGAVAVLAAVLGGWLVGRVVADQAPLPAVGDPVTVVSPDGAGTSGAPTPPAATRSPGDDRDDRRDDSRRDDDDDSIRTVRPSPVEVDDDDHGDDRDDGDDGD